MSQSPIGVKPEKFALYDRAQDLNAAIERYIAAGRPPKPEWGEELGRIAKRLQEIASKSK